MPNRQEDNMQTVTLGATGLEVTPLAYGTWQFGGDWGPVDKQSAMAAIGNARSLGINFFDTAQAYGFGRAERLLGAALAAELRSARKSVVIATKGGLRIDGETLIRDASPAWLRKGVEASLDALGTDYIDLYQVHWPDPATPIPETAAALADLVREGLVKHVGVSNYTTAQIEEFSTVLPVEPVLPPYAAAHHIGVLAYGPLAHGLLGGAITESTTFSAGDWRAHSPAFTGDGFARNLEGHRSAAPLRRPPRRDNCPARGGLGAGP